MHLPDSFYPMFEGLKISIVFAPAGHDLVVNECSEHLCLEEAGEERPVSLRLIGEKRSFVEVHH